MSRKRTRPTASPTLLRDADRPSRGAVVKKLAGNGVTHTPSRQPSPEVERLRELAQVLTEFDLSEIEVGEGKGRLRLRRDREGKAGSPLWPPALMAPMANASSPAIAPSAPLLTSGPSGATSEGTFITSPFVGTFYRSPGPDKPQFVEVGQTIKKGQVVCIIEAMKLMNEIEAEAEGILLEILVDNAQPVEYGQRLFRIGRADKPGRAGS